MFKLCVFVALLSLAAAAPAPGPSGLWGPTVVGPSILGPSILGPHVVSAPVAIAPRVVQVVPSAVSHVSVSQLHPSPLLVKSVW